MTPEFDEREGVDLRRVLLAVQREHVDTITEARRVAAVSGNSASLKVRMARALVSFDEALRPPEWGG